jgi:hypothetical protein
MTSAVVRSHDMTAATRTTLPRPSAGLRSHSTTIPGALGAASQMSICDAAALVVDAGHHPQVVVDLDGCDVVVVQEAVRNKSPWFQRAPLELTTLPTGAHRLPPSLDSLLGCLCPESWLLLLASVGSALAARLEQGSL